jgi:hypothetical protein
MSARNGDKSRYQINRKRAVVRRAKIRAMVAAGTDEEKRPAHAKPQPASPQRASDRLSRAETETGKS